MLFNYSKIKLERHSRPADSFITMWAILEQIRRDPESYKEEFLEQFKHFLQFIKLLELDPNLHRSSIDQLLKVVNFLTAVAFCYPEQSKIFGNKLIELLNAKAEELGHELRLAFCRALVALKNSQRMNGMEVVSMLFEMLRCDDKQLRKFIKSSILSIIKHTKIGSKKQKRNRKKRKVQRSFVNSATNILSAESSKIQSYIFAQINDSRTNCARVAQWILVQAYRKALWRDTKTANVLAECIFHSIPRIKVSTMHFFLGTNEEEEGIDENSDSEDDGPRKDSTSVMNSVISSMKYGKKTNKREKLLNRAKKEVIKSKKSKKESRSKFCNLEAISTIYDPQKIVDRLFRCLEEKKNEKFVIRLLQIALCARLIGVHKLQTLGFYSFIQRYLQPKQKDVTRILLYSAQACHELVPPDLVENLVRRIAQNFITDQNTPEAITVGLNTIREIFTTCPAACTEELLCDLTQYKSYKNKNVSMAAHALITLFRNINPQLLSSKDRGRQFNNSETTLSLNVNTNIEFGALKTVDFVPGSEVLSEQTPAPAIEKSKKKKRRNDSEENSESEWGDIAEDNENEDSKMETESEEESDSSDEEIEEPEVTPPKKIVTFKLSKYEKKKAKINEKKENERQALAQAKLVSEARILTDSDFRAIRVHQIRQQINAEKRFDKLKRKRTNDEAFLDNEMQEKMNRKEEGAGDGLPRLNDIENFRKKIHRQNKAERLAQAQVSQEEKDAHGRPKKAGAHIGRTNREMAKHKNFQMVRQKMRGKNRQRSFRDRQISLRNYLLKQSGRKV